MYFVSVYCVLAFDSKDVHNRAVKLSRAPGPAADRAANRTRSVREAVYPGAQRAARAPRAVGTPVGQ